MSDNPRLNVVMVTRNQPNMTMGSVISVMNQTGPRSIRLHLVHNGLSPADSQTLLNRCNKDYGHHVRHVVLPGVVSLARAWNDAIEDIFTGFCGHEVVVVNNDVALHPKTFSKLVAYLNKHPKTGMVTGVGVGPEDSIEGNGAHPRPNPDFSCFLLTRKTWDTIGHFDTRYKIAYCEDNDFHVRMHLSGIPAVAIDVPFIHPGSGTLAGMSGTEAAEVRAQADKNRRAFKLKWNFEVGSPEYDRFFQTEWNRDTLWLDETVHIVEL